MPPHPKPRSRSHLAESLRRRAHRLLHRILCCLRAIFDRKNYLGEFASPSSFFSCYRFALSWSLGPISSFVDELLVADHGAAAKFAAGHAGLLSLSLSDLFLAVRGPVRFPYNPYFSACFLARIVFFFHNKSARTVFWLVFSAKQTGPESI